MATTKKFLQAAAGAAGGAAGPLAIEDVFSTYLYTGNGSTQTITNGIDLAGEGGLVWIKERTNVSDHALFDTERGAGRYLHSNKTDAAALDITTLSSFNSDGFSVGASFVNDSGRNIASWTFCKAPRFFGVVTWTGDGSSSMTIPHGLETDVGMIAIKRTDSAENWWVVHRATTNGFSDYASLNLTDAFSSGASGISDVTDASFTVNSFYAASGKQYVAYLFAHDPLGPSGDGSDGLIACGSVTTDGSGVASVDLGWEPQWVLTKIAGGGTGGWAIADNMRGIVTGGTDQYLLADQSNAEASYTYLDLTPTGFNLSGLSTSSDYIYIAIRRGPMRVPTSGTEVFGMARGSGSDPSFNVGFTVDFGMGKEPSTSTLPFRLGTRLLQGTYLDIDTGTELAGSAYQFDYQDAWHSGSLGSSWQGWGFKRAPNFFDVVAYEGNNVDQRQVSHNLAAPPEFIIVKTRNVTDNWSVFHTGLTAQSFGGNDWADTVLLNSTVAEFQGLAFRDSTAQTSDYMTLGYGGTSTNESGKNYIAYLFASLDGVSKVGSYTGNGTSAQTIDCGFTTGARFVLIKNATFSDDWFVFDTARGITVGNDQLLKLNLTSAEQSVDYVAPHSSGFIVENNNAVNNGSSTYIFLAIA